MASLDRPWPLIGAVILVILTGACVDKANVKVSHPGLYVDARSNNPERLIAAASSADVAGVQARARAQACMEAVQLGRPVFLNDPSGTCSTMPVGYGTAGYGVGGPIGGAAGYYFGGAPTGQFRQVIVPGNGSVDGAHAGQPASAAEIEELHRRVDAVDERANAANDGSEVALEHLKRLEQEMRRASAPSPQTPTASPSVPSSQTTPSAPVVAPPTSVTAADVAPL